MAQDDAELTAALAELEKLAMWHMSRDIRHAYDEIRRSVIQAREYERAAGPLTLQQQTELRRLRREYIARIKQILAQAQASYEQTVRIYGGRHR